MAHEAYFADIDYFAEDITPDNMFGEADLNDQSSSTNVNNVNLNGTENQFQDTNTSAIIQDINAGTSTIINLEEDPDIPSEEALEIAAYLQAYNNENQDEEENAVIGERMDRHQDNIINPHPLPCSSVIDKQNMDVPMSPVRFGGDSNFSSPDNHKVGDNGFGPTTSPPADHEDTAMVEQNELANGQTNIEPKLEDKTSTSATERVVEASNIENERPALDREQVNQAMFSLAKSMTAEMSAGFPPTDVALVFPYTWQALTLDPRVPLVLKTKEAFDFIQSMAAQGGHGLAVGLSSEEIMALPIIQQFLGSIVHLDQIYPSTGKVNGNLANAGTNNTGSTLKGHRQPTLPPNFAAGRSVPRTILPKPVINNIIQRIGGPEVFRRRYISWRSMSLRPVPVADQPTLNVLHQPDVGEFLRSLDISTSTNATQPSTSIGSNGRHPAGNNVQSYQQRQSTPKATGRRPRQESAAVDNQHNPLPDLVMADNTCLPSSEEMNAVYSRYINSWRNHPAAINTNNPVLDIPYTEIMARQGVHHRQGTGTPQPNAVKPTKAAPRKKSPVKVPRKIHPNAVAMYRHFGDPIPEELLEASEDFEDLSEQSPESIAAQGRLNNNTGNAFQANNMAASRISTVATARATQKMNAHQHASSSIRMTTDHMFEVQELKRIITEQEKTIANQSRVIQAQSGAIQANKYMLETVLAKLNGNQENFAFGSPTLATGGIPGLAYPGLIPSIETPGNHSFTRKRSDSTSESSSLSKRRRGVAGLAIKAPADENRESHDMNHSRSNSFAAEPSVYRGHEELYRLGRQDIGAGEDIAAVSEVDRPRLASSARSRRAATAHTYGPMIKNSAGKMRNGSKLGDQEETSEESNEPAESSGSDYIPPAGT